MADILYLIYAGLFLIACGMWRARRRVRAAVSLIVGLLWLIYADSILAMVMRLGADSLAEAQDFYWREAWYFLHSLYVAMMPVTMRLLPGLGISLVCVLLLWMLRRHPPFYVAMLMRNFVHIGSWLLFFTGMVLAAQVSHVFESNSALYFRTQRNFSQTPPQLDFSRPQLRMVVYIGESTSSMQMGLYGYLRQTTPNLSRRAKQEGLLVFEPVLSTHVHTSPSLLEALSIGVDARENFLLINERRRITVPGIFTANHVPVHVFSNQGRSGVWNFSSSVLFRQATRSVFSTHSQWLGNIDDWAPRPVDDVFFDAHFLPAYRALEEGKGGVFFLHSYGGHGEYLKNIPPSFRQLVDGYYLRRRMTSIAGNFPLRGHDIEYYDQAISYVDFSIEKILAALDKDHNPAVFIYFSDHGDSVFTGAGHDSMRLQHEMLRVPFVVYFNAAARSAYPQLYADYRQLSRRQEVSTLAQLPATLLDLFGAQPAFKAARIGERGDAQPIMVRKTAAGYSHMNPWGKPIGYFYSRWRRDVTDEATQIFNATYYNPSPTTQTCYHRANSIAKALRGTMVADCLEFDIVMQKNSAAAVTHPPVEPSGLVMEDVLRIAQKKGKGVWIDAKNIDDPQHCTALAMRLEKFAWDGDRLVEFPPHTDFTRTGLRACAAALKKLGVRLSYYVPTDGLLACTKHVGDSSHAVPDSCAMLNARLARVAGSGIFDTFSFDFSGVNAMERSRHGHALPWNTWNVEARWLPHIRPERFERIILNSYKDPNSR